MIPLMSVPQTKGERVFAFHFVILLDNKKDSVMIWSFVVYCMWVATSLFQIVEILWEVASSKYAIH